MDATKANLTDPATTLDVTPHAHNGQTTPPSPFTDTSSSAPTLSVGPLTPSTDLTSLPSDVSKLSLSSAKKPPVPEPPTVAWPYSNNIALDDIPGIAYALDTFLKSQMVESEEYCHRIDPRKCVPRMCPKFPIVLLY